VNLKRDTAPEKWMLQNAQSERAAVIVTPSIAVHDPGLILDLTRRGLGIAPVPELYAARALQQGEIVRVLPQWSRGATPVHAVYPSRRILAPKLKVFIEFAAEAIRTAS
jgi:DNA-binding transcriptional LysR family regulator